MAYFELVPQLVFGGVILSEPVLQAGRRISRSGYGPREIPRRAGESAGLRDDAEMKVLQGSN